MEKLDSIFKIYNGYSFRGKVEPDPNGDTHIIQMKNLVDEYTGFDSDLTKVSGDLIKEKYTLEPGDILFISKGSNNYAIPYNLDLPRVVASSVFYVLRRIENDTINPEFIAWYINQAPAQQHIKKQLAGTRIPNVNIDTIKNLLVELPEMKVQDSIANIYNLNNQEQRLLKQITVKRSAFINSLLLKTQTNA